MSERRSKPGPFAWEPMIYEVGRWVTLPVPPSANRYARTGKGRLYTPPEVERYERSIRTYLTAIRATPIRDIPVRLELIWYRGRRSGDLSNRIKILEDVLQTVLFEDDRQVTQITALRVECPERPRVEVRVTPWTAISEAA